MDIAKCSSVILRRNCRDLNDKDFNVFLRALRGKMNNIRLRCFATSLGCPWKKKNASSRSCVAGIKLLPYRKWNSTEYACPSAATDTVEQQIFVEHYLGYYKGVPVAFCNGRSSRTRALRESLRKRQGLVKTRPLFYIVLRYSASNEHPRRGKGQLEKLRTKHLLFN